MDPVVLFFLLGVVARLLKSDLRLPEAMYEGLSIFLLLAIGLKGGVQLAEQSTWDLLPKASMVIGMGLVLPLLAFPVLRWVGKFDRPNAASIAAHYGSVSVVTFAVAITLLNDYGIQYEPYLPVFVVLLEVPGIVVGILLAKGVGANSESRRLTAMREVVFGRSILLLVGGLIIGWIAGGKALIPQGQLFFDLFKGVLSLFMLEMGIVAAGRMSDLRRAGVFLAIFGIVTPLVFSVIGAGLGLLLDLSIGGTMLLATLAASASYIAAPTAMRIAIPQANPALSLGAALGVTFPFNVTLGVPTYLHLARWVHSL